MAKQTVKEKIWKELKKLKKGEQLNMVELSKEIECTLAYVGSICRYALESGFLKFGGDGNYVIEKIPKYEDFKNGVNERYNKYRNSTKTGSTTTSSSRKRKVVIPAKFKVDKDTIVAVISKVIQENKDLEDKLRKVIAYAKIIQKERDDLLKTISETL